MVTLGWRVYYSSGSLLTLAHRLPLRPQTLKSTHFLMASTTTLLSTTTTSTSTTTLTALR